MIQDEWIERVIHNPIGEHGKSDGRGLKHGRQFYLHEPFDLGTAAGLRLVLHQARWQMKKPALVRFFSHILSARRTGA